MAVRKEDRWVVLLAVLASGFLVATLVALVLTVLRKGISSSETASWAQAFGTILAVIGAWGTAAYTVGHADRIKLKERNRLLAHLAGLASQTAEVADKMESHLLSADAGRFERGIPILNDQYLAFRRISAMDVREWPSPFLATAWDLMMIALMGLTNNLNSLNAQLQAKQIDTLQRDDFQKQVNAVRERHDGLIRQLAEIPDRPLRTDLR